MLFSLYMRCLVHKLWNISSTFFYVHQPETFCFAFPYKSDHPVSSKSLLILSYESSSAIHIPSYTQKQATGNHSLTLHVHTAKSISRVEGTASGSAFLVHLGA